MSSRGFTAAWLLAAALLSSWAVSYASGPVRPASPPRVVPRPHALPLVSIELEAEVLRLASRTFSAAPEALAARDPFRFASRPPSRFALRRGRPAPRPALQRGSSAADAPIFATPSSAPAPDIAPPAAASTPAFDVAPLVPALSLTAVAEFKGGALTAVISFGGELHYVKLGDVIAGQYRVDALTMNGVDVFDLTLGIATRLSLHR